LDELFTASGTSNIYKQLNTNKETVKYKQMRNSNDQLNTNNLNNGIQMIGLRKRSNFFCFIEKEECVIIS